MTTVGTVTEATVAATPEAARAADAPTSGRKRRVSRPDRVSLILFTVAGFMVILAVLSLQVQAIPQHRAGRVMLVRKLYRTTVIETIVGAPGKPSVSQSVSATPAPVVGSPAPTTRTS